MSAVLDTLTSAIAAIIAHLDILVQNPALHDVLAILKGARNAIV